MSSADTPPEYTSPLARAIAARSMPLLVRITALPRWAFVVGLTALLVGGLLLGYQDSRGLQALGGVLLLILATFIGWLLAAVLARRGPDWAALTPAGRACRRRRGDRPDRELDP